MVQTLNRSEKIAQTRKFKDIMRCLISQKNPLKPSCAGCNHQSACYSIRMAVK